MKGVLLAGGYGTRLRPLTNITNKHLLPIYNKPMIEYALENLHNANVKDICVILGGSKPEEVAKYLGDGFRYGVRLTYQWQGEPRGIAHAVACAEDFVGNENFVVYLGDNIFTSGIGEFVDEFLEDESDARVLVTEVENPQSYGVIEFKDGEILGLEEKPKNPKSNSIVTGVFCFKPSAFEIARTIKPSWRNEYEITDVIHEMVVSTNYLVKYSIMKGKWYDCGTFDDILNTSLFFQNKMRGR